MSPPPPIMLEGQLILSKNYTNVLGFFMKALLALPWQNANVIFSLLTNIHTFLPFSIYFPCRPSSHKFNLSFQTPAVNKKTEYEHKVKYMIQVGNG